MNSIKLPGWKEETMYRGTFDHQTVQQSYELFENCIEMFPEQTIKSLKISTEIKLIVWWNGDIK